MKKTMLVIAMVSAMALSTMAPAMAKGNSARSEATPAEITSVVAETSDPGAANFEEEFTYYVIRFEEIDHVQWTYREPARLGGKNHEAEWASTSTAFWFGVTAPDGDGIQHEIAHKGQVNMYYETPDGDIYSITAQFNGKGDLLHVNGVEVS